MTRRIKILALTSKNQLNIFMQLAVSMRAENAVLISTEELHHEIFPFCSKRYFSLMFRNNEGAAN